MIDERRVLERRERRAPRCHADKLMLSCSNHHCRYRHAVACKTEGVLEAKAQEYRSRKRAREREASPPAGTRKAPRESPSRFSISETTAGGLDQHSPETCRRLPRWPHHAAQDAPACPRRDGRRSTPAACPARARLKWRRSLAARFDCRAARSARGLAGTVRVLVR